nr:hypothetical protein [Tanacetum cinerariifolium]
MNVLRPQSYYYNQPYPNQPYRNPAPEPYAFHGFGSQLNVFYDFSPQPSAFLFIHPNYVSQTQVGGSSSQQRTNPPMSPIHAFPIEDMYTPKFSDPFQENTTTWTREEEIALCKGWVDVSENNMLGNTRKDAGFWCAILQYLENKTKQYGRRTYDMINGKWKMVRPTVVRFRECTILKDSPKWMQSELPKFAAKSGGGSKRYKSSGSSSFNTESKKASINLNANVGDDEKDEEKEERLAFSDIKMREVECREQGVRNQEYRQRQKDI